VSDTMGAADNKLAHSLNESGKESLKEVGKRECRREVTGTASGMKRRDLMQTKRYGINLKLVEGKSS